MQQRCPCDIVFHQYSMDLVDKRSISPTMHCSFAILTMYIDRLIFIDLSMPMNVGHENYYLLLLSHIVVIELLPVMTKVIILFISCYGKLAAIAIVCLVSNKNLGFIFFCV